MTNIIEVENKIITLRNQQVILANHVAELYGVETREVNQAIKNNPEKFPEGYIFQLENQEFVDLRSKFLTGSKISVFPHGVVLGAKPHGGHA
jgi:hypothetical protein